MIDVQVNQNIKSASDTTSAKWNGLKAKIATDIDNLKSKVAQKKHDLDVKRAANYAELLDEDASFAVDYAIASIEQAKVDRWPPRGRKSQTHSRLIQVFDWISEKPPQGGLSVFQAVILKCPLLAQSGHLDRAHECSLSGESGHVGCVGDPSALTQAHVP